MKIAVIKNKKNYKILEKSNYIIDKLRGINEFDIDELDIISDIKKIKNEYDVYIVITNSINEILLCKRKIKNIRKVLILTGNTNVNFIIYCIEFTKNLLYINVDFDMILKKLYNL